MANLSIVVCGAPLSSRAHELVDLATGLGWRTSLVVTEAARAWVDDAATGFRSPADPKQPRPDAVVVAPMTFNTATKWALGIADTAPLSLLAETLGAGKPMVAVPFVNESLWGHPSWAATLMTLGKSGVVLVDPITGSGDLSALSSGSGERVAASFDPRWVLDHLPAPA